MRKRFKFKKKFKIRYLIILCVMLLVYCFSNYFKNIVLPNKNIINMILQNNNYYAYNGMENKNMYNKIYSYIKNNLINSPINILQNELNNSYLNKEIKTVNFSYVENKDILIYIYNSHQGENYSRKYLEEYNIVPNVLMASLMLKEKLENINIPSIVEESDILDYMKKNNLNHAGSYIASRHFLEIAMNKYPKAELYIDIHRDSATHDISYTLINDKPCAKVLFVIGLEYDTYQNNLNIVTKLNNIINEKYPGLSRGIMKKQGYGVNGVYNQDLSSNVILLEIGGNENDIEEVNNTLDLITNVIGEYINEKE